MLIKKPTVHPLTRSALIEIQSAGVEITPEIVLIINESANQIKRQAEHKEHDLIDWPIHIGGTLLYPLSFGAVEWVGKLPERLQDDIRVIAFACAHSHDLDLLKRLGGQPSVIMAVIKWTLGLKCSMRALESAVDLALGGEQYIEVPDNQPPAKSWRYDAVIRALCAKYPGTTPDYWLWSVSREKCFAMLQDDSPDTSDKSKPTEHECLMDINFRLLIKHIKNGGLNGG